MTDESAQLTLSVVISTHNPRMDYLARVLDALRQQTLAKDVWELVIIDNGSREALAVASSQSSGGSEGNGGRKEAQEGGGQKSEVGSRRTSGVGDGGPGTSESELEADRLEYVSNSKGQGDLKLTNLKPKTTELKLGWHPHARVVREESLGLTFARLRGFAEARGELIVMVDDDNVLAPDYLATAARIAEEQPPLGAFGGKCLPEFEVEPPDWIEDVRKALGLRDRGEREEFFPEAVVAEGWQSSVGSFQSRENGRLTADHGRPATANRQLRAARDFPDCAPIGAGMVLRTAAAAAYAECIKQRTAGPQDNGTITDRKGDSLASGGDNDICLTVIEEGWQVGYFPQLQLTHLIPEGRLTAAYHKRAACESMQSFVLMLDQHGVWPWPTIQRWTLPLRIAREYFRHKAWRGDLESIRWWGSVGQCLGRSKLRGSRHSSDQP